LSDRYNQELQGAVRELTLGQPFYLVVFSSGKIGVINFKKDKTFLPFSA
jgi:hypothetical protein